MTILLADDDTRYRESVKRFLSRRLPGRHVFLEADNGTAAVALYSATPIDWVVMDIQMSPMDGLEALRKIRQADPEAKVVILTLYDDAQYRKAAQQAGARDFVVKERMEELISVLKRG